MNTKSLKDRIKKNQKLKDLILYLITPPTRPRPRWYIRLFVNPLVHKYGRGSLIRRSARMDIFPFKKFKIGANSTIESFCVINNGAGDVIIEDNARVGIGTVIIGPVILKQGSGTGQHVFIGGFNHGYSDGNTNSKYQPLDVKGVVVEEEAHIGANSVVLAGVTIGKRCQIGAGSVVTKSIPDFSIAVGNPCKVIKKFNFELNKWEKCI